MDPSDTYRTAQALRVLEDESVNKRRFDQAIETTLNDLVHLVAPEGGPLVGILLERADRVLAKEGGRACKRPLTDVEIDLLLAGDEPPDVAR